jgi:hypothetical protein
MAYKPPTAHKPRGGGPAKKNPAEVAGRSVLGRPNGPRSRALPRESMMLRVMAVPDEH